MNSLFKPSFDNEGLMTMIFDVMAFQNLSFDSIDDLAKTNPYVRERMKKLKKYFTMERYKSVVENKNTAITPLNEYLFSRFVKGNDTNTVFDPDDYDKKGVKKIINDMLQMAYNRLYLVKNLDSGLGFKPRYSFLVLANAQNKKGNLSADTRFETAKGKEMMEEMLKFNNVYSIPLFVSNGGGLMVRKRANEQREQFFMNNNKDIMEQK